MNKPIYFAAIESNTAIQNLEAFVSMCRNELTVFGKDLAFDENVWDITDTIKQKGKNTRSRIIFSTFEEAKQENSKKKATHQNIKAMQEPFLSFAKAYIRYQMGLKQRKSNTILQTIRLVESTLEEAKGYADPIDIDADILSLAANTAFEYYTRAAAYRIGGALARLGKFLNDKRLAKISIDWKSPIKRPSDTSRVGKKADDNRNKKMPSQAAIEALPEIFFKADTPYAQIASSIIALLFAAPNRINEVLLLPYDCEVIMKDRDGQEQYGLRWFPAKGAEPMVKWVIPSMVNTIKEAVRRLKYETTSAREIARWYDRHPDKIYLPKELEHLRNNEYVETTEAALIIYGEEKTIGITSWYKSHNVPYFIKTSKTGGYKSAPHKRTVVRFEDLEIAVLKLLPIGFPIINKETGLKYADALLLQKINEYNSKKGTLIPTINGFGHGFVSDALQRRESLNKKTGQISIIKSLFDLYGYTEKDGSPIRATSHQFRHYLNTLAQKGGASQLDIAKWSGRLDVQQNTDYDHVTADEMLEMVREAVGDEDAMVGPLANIEDIKKKVVITRDEYARLKVRTAHRTDYGVCIHDFTMMPCPLHRDCINCVEQVCMKGDKTGNQNIIERKEDVGRLLQIAKDAQQDGHIGANRWIEHHSIEYERLSQIVALLDDPNVPEGSFIQLSNIPVASMIEQAESRRKEIIKEDTSIDFDEMSGFLLEMGGEK